MARTFKKKILEIGPALPGNVQQLEIQEDWLKKKKTNIFHIAEENPAALVIGVTASDKKICKELNERYVKDLKTRNIVFVHAIAGTQHEDLKIKNLHVELDLWDDDYKIDEKITKNYFDEIHINFVLSSSNYLIMADRETRQRGLKQRDNRPKRYEDLIGEDGMLHYGHKKYERNEYDFSYAKNILDEVASLLKNGGKLYTEDPFDVEELHETTYVYKNAYVHLRKFIDTHLETHGFEFEKRIEPRSCFGKRYPKATLARVFVKKR